ncbi:phospholipase D-like domain-containing protein [Actinoplanes auranticolor]|uniref:PLD phosphodiesterase domain-containing protein n=1 Tax=Actinoplanes auranticolor TaxID=47988 RepID=A0A919SZ95_9ACTN|nr:phospholipase D-like domain-containing protein [Actinoplanes auranticolor]GIM80136.1 hypothetical protein Aau02nite_89150 [Actinoplanes auranticolor]
MSDTPAFVVPEQIQGAWTNLIVLTYSAHLDFFETHLLRQLSRVPNRIILADDRRLADQFATAARTGQRLGQANRTYMAAPIRNPWAAHAKAVLLTTSTAGRLLVGSGNLGPDGYTEPGELWHKYTYDDGAGEHLDVFAAVRSLIDGIAARRWLDPAAVSALDLTWSSTPWLPPRPTGRQALHHNLDTPLIEAITAAVDGPVDLLTAYAPFHDEEATALGRLLDRLRPRRLRVLLTSDTSVDGERLSAVVNRPGTAVSLERAQVTDAPTAFLHAKIIHVVCVDREVLVTGSANLSRRALLLPATTGNIELAVIETRPPGGFAGLYMPLTVQPLPVAEPLMLRFRGGGDLPPADTAAVLYSELRGNLLTLVLTTAVTSGVPQLVFPDGTALLALAAEDDGTVFRFRLTDADVERLARGGRIDVRLPGSVEGAEPEPTWPYHVDALRGRTARTADNHLLGSTGSLPGTDDDLSQLLKQLEQALIFDPETAWKVAGGRTATPADDGGEAESVRWEEIDWERLYRHPRYRGYQHNSRPDGQRASDIEVILSSIAARLKGVTGSPSVADKDDDLGASSEPDDTGDEEQLTRHLSVSTRTRMACNRLAVRYTAALQDVVFQEKLGPTLTVRNAVILSHVLRELLHSDAIDPGHAITAQLASWSFLWGPQGLIASLPDQEREAAEQVLTEAQARQTTLRALAELTEYDFDDELRRAVREHTQALLLSPALGFDQHLLTLTAPDARQAAALVANLRYLAGDYTDSEIVELMTTGWGIATTAVGWETSVVRRPPCRGRPARSDEADVLRVQKHIPGLTADRAGADLARLAAHMIVARVDFDYVRIRFAEGRDVAYWDAAAGEGICFIADDEKELTDLQPEFPAWWQHLDKLDGRPAASVAA